MPKKFSLTIKFFILIIFFVNKKCTKWGGLLDQLLQVGHVECWRNVTPEKIEIVFFENQKISPSLPVQKCDFIAGLAFEECAKKTTQVAEGQNARLVNVQQLNLTRI